ncbi:MAG: 3-phosphoshikimate 1-carboxyvinyltransferase [Candidatus Cloacimonadales bacterium]|nr:3-phosphoshikimate 1-carboxyvinyltransferase [Candidatus Cloacimonadales bacterium]
MNSISRKIIRLEGSKSILNRILIISTLLDTPLKFSQSSSCTDIHTLIQNLEKLGFHYKKSEEFSEVSSDFTLPEEVDLFIKDSGTAWRFLLTRLANWEGLESTIDVSEQLRKRPIKPLIEVLKKLGAEIEADEFPIKIHGKQLSGGKISISAEISSQFISSLLLVAPTLKSDLILKLEGFPVSLPYINMTRKIMQDCGIETSWERNMIRVSAGQKYHYDGIYEVEPDFSSACYFWAMGALSEDWICTQNFSGISLQPDFGFLEILRKLGAEVNITPDRICIRKNQLNGIEIDLKTMPDQVPTLAVLAIFADIPTVISGIEHLRYKESDRISALSEEFDKLKVRIKYAKGRLYIYPNLKIKENIVLNAHNDHRIAMALHILKFIYPQIILNKTDCIIKSYPDFFTDFKSILV